MAYFSYMYIICSALLYKSYLSLPYVTSLWDSFYLKWTFANGFVMLPPSSLASLQSCLLAISLRFGSFLVFSEIGQYIYTIHIPEDFQVLMGFLPFTWANWSVYGLHKWYAKLRTGKFCAETTQKSHVPFTFQPDFLESFCKW